jgi:hypothetical protein
MRRVRPRRGGSCAHADGDAGVGVRVGGASSSSASRRSARGLPRKEMPRLLATVAHPVGPTVRPLETLAFSHA